MKRSGRTLRVVTSAVALAGLVACRSGTPPPTVTGASTVTLSVQGMT